MRGLLYTILLAPVLLMTAPAEAVSKEVRGMLDNIKWLGHDTFLITGDRTIYTDPFQISKTGPVADIVLITHEHRDHCSPEDAAKVSGPGTVIVTTPDCVAKLKGVANKEIRTVRPGDKLEIDGIEIEAVRAYNTNKKFHPRENDWVGFIFTSGGLRYYLAGDTDHIPEMKEIRCDVALLPVSGTYVMTAQEAVGAALDINPKVAVPMHYGAIVGEASDAGKFASALEGKLDVMVLTKE
jgi:L-ascorbate metabolism protein UlaG (beta-lactamase superfamily)